MPQPFEVPGLPWNPDYHRAITLNLLEMYSTPAGNGLGIGGLAAPVIKFQDGALMALATDDAHYWGILNRPGPPGAPGPHASMWVGDLYASASVIGDPWAGDDREDTQAPPYTNSRLGLWSRTVICDGFMFCDTITNPSADMKTGIGMGHVQVAEIPAAPTQALALLYARWDIPRWELLVSRGTGTNFSIVPLTGVLGPTLDKVYHLRLVWVGGQYCAAYVSGQEGARITDSTKFPGPNAANPGFSFFAQSGTAAGAVISSALAWPRMTVLGK